MPVESVRFRQRRHALLLSLVDTLPRPLTILDVGGTVHYWRHYGVPRDVHITLLNRGPAPADLPPNFYYVQGDACAMQFADNEFDVVFSNSVIEHVGEWARQQAMAHEVQRVGHSIWVQTPSRWFPWEPHYDSALLPVLAVGPASCGGALEVSTTESIWECGVRRGGVSQYALA